MPEPAASNEAPPPVALTLYSAGGAAPRRKRRVNIEALYAAARGDTLDPAAFMAAPGWSPLTPDPAAGPPVSAGAGPVATPGIRSVRVR